MKIAADKCIYSNHNFVVKKIGESPKKDSAPEGGARDQEARAKTAEDKGGTK